jgi:hypothetical protein
LNNIMSFEYFYVFEKIIALVIEIYFNSAGYSPTSRWMHQCTTRAHPHTACQPHAHGAWSHVITC